MFLVSEFPSRRILHRTKIIKLFIQKCGHIDFLLKQMDQDTLDTLLVFIDMDPYLAQILIEFGIDLKLLEGKDGSVCNIKSF